MTLRRRLALHYAGVVVVTLLLLAGLIYHKFNTEKRLRTALGLQNTPRDWSDSGDLLVGALIPVVLVSGWWFTRRSLQPLSDLAKTVEHTGIDSLREPLPRSGNHDEVDRLTEALNAMAVRLHESFQQIREFTLHASHELKTPLTVMRGELETAMQHETSYTAPQRECMHNLLDEIERLTRIVDALTLLTKADAGQISLERQPVRLAELVRESFEDAQILAESNDVRVTLGECADVMVVGDRHRLRQLLLNLVDNAVKYNEPGGHVAMSLRQVDGTAQIVIANTGLTIPPDLQRRVFDRFVRGDEARGRAIDGCGLGLTIVRWIAKAHRGTIDLSSEPGKTTTATVQLPLGER